MASCPSIGASPPSPTIDRQPRPRQALRPRFLPSQNRLFPTKRPTRRRGDAARRDSRRRPDPQPPGTEGVRDPSIASACWRLERAWRLVGADGDDCAELHRAPSKRPSSCTPQSSKSGSPHVTARRDNSPSRGSPATQRTPAHSALRLRATQCQQPELFGSESVRGRALPIATHDIDDFYTVCAARLMENGRKAAPMQDAYTAVDT